MVLEALAVGDLHVDEDERQPLALVEASLTVHRPLHVRRLYALLRSRSVDRSGVTEERDPAKRDPAKRDPAKRGPAKRGPAKRDPAERAALITFLAAEAVAFVIYVVVSRPMWFYLDEWDFLADRTAFNVGDLFRAHNEHWVTLPVLAYRGLWWVFGLNSYRPYQVVIILLHLLAAFLVRSVMRRVGVRPWTATVVASVLVFFGSGYQNIVLPFQMTLVGALVFGLVYLLLATHDGPFDRRDVFGWLAGLASIMCSGVGVSMVIAVGLAVLLMRGWRLALVHTVPFAALYVVWYAWVGHVGYDGYHAGPGQVVSFVRTFVAATFGAHRPLPRHGRRARRAARRRPGRRVVAAAVARAAAARRDTRRAARRRARAAVHHGVRAGRPLVVPGEEPLPAPRRRADPARGRGRGRRADATVAGADDRRRGGAARRHPEQRQRDRRLHAPPHRREPDGLQADDAVTPPSADGAAGAARRETRAVPRPLRDDRLAPRRRGVGPDPEARAIRARRGGDGRPAPVVPAGRARRRRTPSASR